VPQASLKYWRTPGRALLLRPSRWSSGGARRACDEIFARKGRNAEHRKDAGDSLVEIRDWFVVADDDRPLLIPVGTGATGLSSQPPCDSDPSQSELDMPQRTLLRIESAEVGEGARVLGAQHLAREAVVAARNVLRTRIGCETASRLGTGA